jgi:hypothetical protein
MGCCNLNSHLCPKFETLLLMDPITSKFFSHKEVDCISNCIWEIVKWIGDSLEAKDDESNNTARNIVVCNQSLCNWHATSCHLQL